MMNWWRIANVDEVASPALLVYPERAEENLRRLIRVAGGVSRLRPHMKTMKSVEAALRTRDYQRLRVGVGQLPAGADLADWVLTPFEPEDEETVRDLLPTLVDAVECWVREGIEAAANRFNR